MSSEPASGVLGESFRAHRCSYSAEGVRREYLFDLRLAPANLMPKQSGTAPTVRVPYYYWHSARSWGGAPRVFDEVQRRTPAPVFFLSYAHPGQSRRQGAREANSLVLDFFDELSDNVGLLVGRPSGADTGYMDGSIPAGGRWTKELLTAVGTCQAFVALLSVPYVDSPWCSKEWGAFAQRNVIRRSATDSEHPTGIFPVVWAPLSTDQMPAQVRDVQRFSPTGLPDSDIRGQYETNGVFGLSKIRGQEAFKAIVWTLALRIAEFLSHHWVEHRTLAKEDLRDIFRSKDRE
jgi:TIR domain